MFTPAEEIAEFLASNTYADSTKRTYQDLLNRLITQTDPASLTAAGLIKFVQSQKWGNSRQCVALAASQQFIRWKFGQSHPALNARLKRTAGKPQDSLDKNTALKLLASFDPWTPKGARDLAIAALAIDTGLRASELCRLQLSHTNLNQNSLEVVVKGGSWEAAIFTPQTGAHLAHWLTFRKAAKGTKSLFVNILTGKQITVEGLHSIVKIWGKNLEINLTTHDFRRTFAVLATEEGAPERVIMDGGRWKTSQMVKRYTRNLRFEAMRQYLSGKNF